MVFGFFPRLVLLLALMTVAAAADLWWYRERAVRWREYLFLVVAGLAGGTFGVINDQITATISAEYFELGKGIEQSQRFFQEVALLGFQAGCVAGMVIGSAFLLANQPRSGKAAIPLPELFGLVRYPLGLAVGMVPPAVLVSLQFDPLDLQPVLEEMISQDQVRRVLTVWGIHAGLYLGGALGTVLAISRIARRRSTLSAALAHSI